MKSKTTRPDYVYVTYINTTPRKLWAALTDSKLIPQFWLGRKVASTWAKGAVVTSHDPDGDLEWTGKVVESRPPHRLTYTFQMPGPKQAVTKVTYDIEKIEKDSMLYGKGLKLTLTHAGYAPGTQPYIGISWGWPVIMSGLKSLLETGRATTK